MKAQKKRGLPLIARIDLILPTSLGRRRKQVKDGHQEEDGTVSKKKAPSKS